MDTTTLVATPDVELKQTGIDAAKALRANKKLDVRAVLWWFDKDSVRWKLLVSTPVCNKEGPRTAYSLIRQTLEKHELLDALPLDRVWAVEDGHVIVEALRRITRQQHVTIINVNLFGLEIAGVHTLWMGQQGRTVR